MGEGLSEKNEISLDYYIRNFNLHEVLCEDSSQKIIFLKGDIEEINGRKTCILILERPQFSPEDLSNILTTANPKIIIDNYIYRTMKLCDAKSTDAIKATMIYPATEKHIEKYRSQDLHMIYESQSDYINITLPHISQSSFSLEWLYNILDKKSEAERIIFEDISDPTTSFILLPDLKWTSGDSSELYLVAIVHRRDLKSIRDLTQKHLPLLENIKIKSYEAITSKYNISSNQLRSYVHYQPSYYHLHIHFTNLKLENSGCLAGKAILLHDVIDNIKMNSDYYMQKTLGFMLRKNDELYEKFSIAGRI